MSKDVPSQFDSTFIHVLDVMRCHPDTSFLVNAFILKRPRVRSAAGSCLGRSTGSAFGLQGATYLKVMLPSGEAANIGDWSVVEDTETWPFISFCHLSSQAPTVWAVASGVTTPQPIFLSTQSQVPHSRQCYFQEKPPANLRTNLCSRVFPREL